MDKTQILKNIGTIAKAAKSLTGKIQETAVACVIHAVRHGDVTLADQLVEALGKGMRRASLRAWFERNGPIVLPRGKDKFAFDGERAKAMRKESDEELTERLMALPWEEAKPEEPVVSVFDVEEAFDKFLKRLEKQVKEVDLTVKNRELLELVGQQVARYHAEKVLAGVEPTEKTEALPTVRLVKESPEKAAAKAEKAEK